MKRLIYIILALIPVLLYACGGGGGGGESLAPAVGIPGNVAATAGNGQITLTWDSVEGATSYNIYWSTTAGVTETTGTKIMDVSSPYVHTGLQNDTTYYYYAVSAVNSAGESALSEEVFAKPSQNPPPLP